MPRTTVKDEILSLLSERRGTLFSGAALADRLGVSRAAVWKAVDALRAAGFPISGTPNRGYALDADYDLLTVTDMETALTREASEFYQLNLFSMIDSTNTALVAAGRDGAAEGTVYVAEAQTAGKGRMGRSFYSPQGTGIYISVLLRPSIPAREALYITTMAAVAGSRAAETVQYHFHLTVQPVLIKWVNDLFIRGRKFAGILTEADYNVETGGLSQAVMGIGFNLSPPEGGWPEEVSAVAGSLFEKKQPVGARACLAAVFLNEFHSLYAALPDHSFVAEYRSHSLVLGKKVEVLRDTEVLYTALAADVDDACSLVVIPDGQTEPVTLNSGEVRIRM